MFKENLELREKVFRKMGFVLENLYSEKYEYEAYYIWRKPEWRNTDEWWKNLPPIETSWEVCAEYLVPFMRGKGVEYRIESESDKGTFWLAGYNENGSRYIRCLYKTITNDNIALAACEAFMEVKI